MARRKQEISETIFDEKIVTTEYSELMQKNYIDYAMSVIVARALPDVRDGLKPVQRRVLYDMSELGIRSDKPYRKSARIVGDTMGKYHPHGDSSIYDSLVVMAQDFKKTLPLVDGHGNFGTIEGDGAAAMRYTEARLQKVTEEALLADLDKDVVDFQPNFDETEKEPGVLPCMIPNFLINGSEGIAVGMATSTPTHNPGEAIDAQIRLLEHPDTTTEELMELLPGPDFPTGGIVINKEDLPEIYETGMGKIKLRGRVSEEKGRAGHILLVITEIPYTMIGAGIGKFLQDVANLAETRQTSDIVDISNQSSKEGIRIVIELRKDTDVENFKNLLYKKTKLEDTFGVNMLAIKNGRPETLGLKEILQSNNDFAYEVTRRKYENLLEAEQKKREIQEGLIKAVNVIDLVIEILRGSKDRAMAKKCLVEGATEGIRFKSKESQVMAAQLQFTEPQANAILDMRLYKLIGLELDALIKEHETTVANIYEYEDILESRRSMTSVIRKTLQSFKKVYGRDRRTEITHAEEAVVVRQEVKEMDVMFLMDRFGYCRTIDLSVYDKNKDKIHDENRYIQPIKNTGRLCMFTDAGIMHVVKMEDVPLKRLSDKGIPVDNICKFDSTQEEIIYMTDLASMPEKSFLFVTRQSMVKQVPGSEFDVSRYSVAATKLLAQDKVASIREITDQVSMVLISTDGFFLKFPLTDVPEQKKAAVGAKGMKLGKDDTVEAAYLLETGGPNVITYHEREVDLGRIKTTSRGGRGSKH